MEGMGVGKTKTGEEISQSKEDETYEFHILNCSSRHQLSGKATQSPDKVLAESGTGTWILRRGLGVSCYSFYSSRESPEGGLVQEVWARVQS